MGAGIEVGGHRDSLEFVRSASPPAVRVASSLDTLLILSRSLPVAKAGSLLADALDLLLAGIGCARGAAYRADEGALELVGERGLPQPLRSALRRLPLSGAPWFAAQRAALSLKPVFDRDLATGAGPLDRAALGFAQWGQVMACPIASGREVHGVLVFAWPPSEEPVCAAHAVVEIACGMIAAHLGRRAGEQRRSGSPDDGARAPRPATLGILAGGFAEELGAQLAEVGRCIEEERRMSCALRVRLAQHEGERALAAPRTRDPARALVAARESTARFLSAIQPAAPARLELGALAADVLALAAPHLRRRRIDVALEADGHPFVVGRRGELMQLFVHLILGVIGVRDDADEVASDRSSLIPRAFKLAVRRRERQVLVSMSDEGAGARSSLFDQVSEDHLDLEIPRRILGAHEGRIEVGPGLDGAYWSVALPVATSEIERRAARVTVPRGAFSGAARPVLVWIDEDDLFLEIMVQSLPEIDVRVARSAAEAMQLFSFGVSPALVLCNVRLPDRPGHALHADLDTRRPGLGARFAFVSDGVVAPEVAGYVMASGRPTLRRPIDLDQIKALALQAPEPLDRAAIVPVAPVASAAPRALPDARVDPQRAPTVPERLALRTLDDVSSLAGPASLARRPATEPPPTPSTHGMPRSAMREQELDAAARATVEMLRREGPKRGAIVGAMLRERGLSEPEALSVLSYALSRRILLRDPLPSTLLRVPDADAARRVLVVDDDFDLCQTLREVLQDEGYGVDTAANGREALDRLQGSQPPGLVVLDLMMPVMDGWKVLDELARDASLSRIPVVVISAGRTGVRGANLPRGHEFLSKPLDYHKLVTTIDRSMRLCPPP
jgi:CheY-like chemotaxis protein